MGRQKPCTYAAAEQIKADDEQTERDFPVPMKAYEGQKECAFGEQPWEIVAKLQQLRDCEDGCGDQ